MRPMSWDLSCWLCCPRWCTELLFFCRPPLRASTAPTVALLEARREPLPAAAALPSPHSLDTREYDHVACGLFPISNAKFVLDAGAFLYCLLTVFFRQFSDVKKYIRVSAAGPDKPIAPVGEKFDSSRFHPCFLSKKRSEERRVGKECRSRW